MIYFNASGTSKPSFKIGPKGVSISSQAVESGVKIVKGFEKRLAVDGKGLLYDCEIPITLVKSIEKDDKNKTFTFTLYNRDTDEEAQFVVQAGVGNTTVSFSGESAEVNNLAAFSDTTGNRIHDSGYSVYPGGFDNEETASKDDEIPTVSAVKEYVGDLNSILEQRLFGGDSSEIIQKYRPDYNRSTDNN